MRAWQDSGDYAGYEQALQRGFTKVAKAPKKVRCAPALQHMTLVHSGVP